MAIILIAIAFFIACCAAYKIGRDHGFDAGYWKAAETLTAPPKQEENKYPTADELEKELDHVFDRIKIVQNTLNELQALSDQELDLISQVDRPSASALHSRHKNKLIDEIKDIREKRIELVKRLLKFGYDPLTPFLDENNKRIEMRLSDILVRLEKSDGKPAPVTEIKKPEKKKPAFKLYTNKGDTHDND